VRSITPASISVLMLIIVFGLIGFYVMKSMMPSAPAPAVVGTRAVPMASADIPAGTLITKEHVVLGRLSNDKFKGKPDIITNKDVVVGRYALKDIKQATPIHTSDLYAPGSRPALEVAPGMRAVTIGLGDSTAVVDGLIKPGDYVDVHLTIDNNSADKRYRGGFTTTMFKGVKVLAMNRLTQQSTSLSRGANTVTFELTPSQSNILLQAKTKGVLSVTYTPNGPGTGGVEVAEADRAYFDEILGLPEIPKPEKPFTTELYRGSSRSVINYDDDYRGNDNNGRATPWIEQPGWAPPRNGGNRGYRGNYGNGYRGTRNDQGGSDQQGARNAVDVSPRDTVRAHSA